jgi:hypothetical protein
MVGGFRLFFGRHFTSVNHVDSDNIQEYSDVDSDNMTTFNRKQQFAKLWLASPWLTAAGALLVPTLLFCLGGLVLDQRLVTAAPVWLKPAKFAISSLLYAWTLAWFFRFIIIYPRILRLVGNLIAAVLIIEQVVIMWQAGRGVTSHFNYSTPFNAAMFGIMAVSILLLLLASLVVLVLLWRQPFSDAPLGRALRIGMLVSVLGASTGGLMVQPTPEQRANFQKTHRLPISGAHTVGAPDGGPGLPLTKWSTRHGDLRIPHFLGLHAIQILPLLLWLLRRRRPAWDAALLTRVATVLGASYGAAAGILLWQALRGQSIVEPDASTVAALATWLLLTVTGLLWARLARTQSWRGQSAAGVAL